MLSKKATDMTRGVIWKQLLEFSVPMAIGLLFQQLYNTVDTLVVGRFVGTEALAAVGCNGSIINMLVGTFSGLATGAGVVISQAFGAHDDERLEKAVHTTLALTLILCVLGTLAGILLVEPLLSLTNTPDNVMADAKSYLTIYFAGLTGLMIYNMGTGILRAVGDSARPLYFLIVSAITNTVLDLVFVIVFKMGVNGVAWATIIAEMLSAVLVVLALLKAEGRYRLRLSLLRINKEPLMRILALGLPSALQSGLTAFSNVFVQSYINQFGSAGMAGWSTYGKLDSFVLVPMQALSMAATTFVGQNWGAKQPERARLGVSMALKMSLGCTFVLMAAMLAFTKPLVSVFTDDPEVLEYGVYYIRVITPTFFTCCFNQIYAASIRGIGDAKTPTIIMLLSFVAFRQAYLYVTKLLGGGLLSVALAYPMGWLLCSALLIIFYRRSALCKKPASKAL